MIARFLFEISPWPPLMTVLWVGYAEMGWDFRVYRTRAGQAYLDTL